MSDLLARARREGTPLIDGDRVTFVWRGRAAPRLVGDFTSWEEAPVALRPLGPALWCRSLEFHRDAYVEYGYLAADRRLRDPLNPRIVSNGVGASNHYFYMPGGAPTELARARREVPRGRLTRHELPSDALGATPTRRIDLYAPAARGPWPLVVVLDGNDYLERARFATIVDNLVTQRRIRPLALAFVAHGGPARVVEYACSDATLAMLTERVLPFARGRLDLASRAGAHGILGASMGGLMALYAGLRKPGIFGRVLSQSGAFTLDGLDTVVFDLVRALPKRPLEVWMDVGHLERLAAANRRMRALLRRRGYRVAYREYHAGHNWSAWRDDVWRGLEELFPPNARARQAARRARAGARAGRGGPA